MSECLFKTRYSGYFFFLFPGTCINRIYTEVPYTLNTFFLFKMGLTCSGALSLKLVLNYFLFTWRLCFSYSNFRNAIPSMLLGTLLPSQTLNKTCPITSLFFLFVRNCTLFWLFLHRKKLRGHKPIFLLILNHRKCLTFPSNYFPLEVPL